MRICFYWLNLDTPPGMSIGVSILARLLAEAGHRVRVVHLNERVGLPFDLTKILDEPGVRDAELHALSFGQSHAVGAMELAEALKEAVPGSFLLCGGIHTTLNAEEVLAHPAVDAVGLGEVDDVLPRFVAALAAGEVRPEVPGFWVKAEGRIHRTEVPALPDLQGSGLPFFEGVDYPRIIAANRGFAEVIAGRGCALRCHYCHNDAMVEILRRHSPEPPARKAFCRRRPVDRVLAELEEVQHRFGAELRAFVFSDDNFAASRSWLRDFAPRYQARVGLPFVCNAIPEQVDPEVATLLADAGCNLVKFGVESGAERVRREVLGRRLSEPRLADAVTALGAVGVNTRAYVLLGAPGETAAEMEATVSLCARLRFDSVRPAILTPFPGTVLYSRCLERGLISATRRATDYSTTTVLNLPAAQRRHIERSAALFPWLLNMHLGPVVADEARPLVDAVRALRGEDWSVTEGRRRVAELGAEAHARLQAREVDHYHAPFRDRPDVTFLYRRRARPLINVDDDSVSG